MGRKSVSLAESISPLSCNNRNLSTAGSHLSSSRPSLSPRLSTGKTPCFEFKLASYPHNPQPLLLLLFIYISGISIVLLIAVADPKNWG